MTLNWAAAPTTSADPVSYRVEASPDGRRPARRGARAAVLGLGLRTACTYTCPITPSNDRGDGPAQSVQATPGTTPAIANGAIERTGDRRFRVSFDVDDGGRRDRALLGDGGPAGGRLHARRRQRHGGRRRQPVRQQLHVHAARHRRRLGTVDGGGLAVRRRGKPLVVEPTPQPVGRGPCTWKESRRHPARTSRPQPGTQLHVGGGYIPHGETVGPSAGPPAARSATTTSSTPTAGCGWAAGYMNTLYFEGLPRP